MDRRDFFGALGATAGTLLLPGAAVLAGEKAAGLSANADAGAVASDEDFWTSIRLAFDVDRSIVNLNSGGYSNPPRVVTEVLRRRMSFAALARYHYSMHVMNKSRETVRRKVARLARTDPEQTALVRNTTEAMCIVFHGTGLKKGDRVLASSLEYPGGRGFQGSWRGRVGAPGTRLNYPIRRSFIKIGLAGSAFPYQEAGLFDFLRQEELGW